MRRILCVWFPLWPIQRVRAAQPELRQTPLVLHAALRGKLVVHCCSPLASKEGVKPGMPLGEAQAILGSETSAVFLQHDTSADAAALRRAAVWCQRFSPLVAAEEPDSLLLDITGCGPVFGGEQTLAEKVPKELRKRGYIVKLAIADTARAAWALAHYHGKSLYVAAAGTHRAALRALPLEALRLPEEAVQVLGELDIRCIGQLMELPRAALPSRFGPQLIYLLDQALGDVADALALQGFVEPIEASWTFEHPCADSASLERVLEHLLDEITPKLRRQNLGVQGIWCGLHHAGCEPQSLTIGLLQASQSARYLMKLLRLHLERVQLSGEVTAITLRALAVPLQFHQEQIFEADPWTERSRRFPALIEALSNRLGKNVVLRPLPQPDPLPELSWRYEPWLDQHAVSLASKTAAVREQRKELYRPSLLKKQPVAVSVMSVVPLGPPLRFQWGRRNLIVAHCWGPERIETGWWRDADVGRDYYLVEATTGERFWLFRTTDQERWFLHGTFG